MEDQTLARDAMARAGVPHDLAHHVEIRSAAPIDGDEARAVVAVGYASGDRFADTAMVNVPNRATAIAFMADPDRILPLIALGARAMPSSVRPYVPEWIQRTASAARRDMKRASALANDAVRGKTVDHVDGPSTGDEPF